MLGIVFVLIAAAALSHPPQADLAATPEPIHSRRAVVSVEPIDTRRGGAALDARWVPLPCTRVGQRMVC